MPSQEDDILSDDLGFISLLSRLIFPASRLKPSFHIELLSLLDILLYDFGKPSPNNDIVEFALLLLHSSVVFPCSIGCKSEIGDELSAGSLLDFRVSGNISDQLNFIQRIHILSIDKKIRIVINHGPIIVKKNQIQIFA